MLIDTHAHVNFNNFKNNFEEVIKRAADKGIYMINVGSQISTSCRAVEFAKKFRNCYAAVGLHPIQLEEQNVEEEGVFFKTRAESFERTLYLELANQKKVVAIGECGLEYFHLANGDLNAIKNKQRKTLAEQISLANERELPLIIHCRGSKDNEVDAYEDLFEELKNQPPKKGAVIHCCTAPWAITKKFIDAGYYIGFNGIITFDKTGRLEELVQRTPLKNILLETDCPWLTPEPFRGRPNEPAYVEFVAQKISQLKTVDFETVAMETTNNAKKLFGLAI